MVTRINKDLANDFGNLAQRVLSMISKNFEGVVPYPHKNAECNFKSFETLSLSQNLLSKVSPLIHILTTFTKTKKKFLIRWEKIKG